jgi:YD repeat-containing protein
MYLADASFKVTDASGKVTEYMHHPYTKPAVLNDPMFRVPRLVGIKSGNRSTPYVTYDYVSQVQESGYSMLPTYVAGPVAQLSTATMDGQTVGYTVAATYQYEGNYVNGSGAPYGTSRVVYNGEFGIWEIVSWDRTVERETSRVNRVKSVYQAAGGYTYLFGYDPNSTRQNVTSITRNGTVVQTASYPATCDNRKTCNEPTWTRDALNHQTDYEYDPGTGLPTRIRKPADSTGVRPEIRNTYTAKYATYLASAIAMQRAATPVYLLTRTRTCISTSTLADGSGCAGGSADEVVTDLDYGPDSGPNNLLLRGEAVTAYVNGSVQTRRTCYSYDTLGNRIGVTTPNAALAACY